MVVITGFCTNLTRSVKQTPWPEELKSYIFAATSDHLPSHPTKDGRSTDCCFVLIEAQCRILMVDAGCPAASKFTPSETLVVSASTISMPH